jgi:hypothetical protein
VPFLDFLACLANAFKVVRFAALSTGRENMMPVRFQFDSGETCNIITTHALTELGIRDLTKTKKSTENVQ